MARIHTLIFVTGLALFVSPIVFARQANPPNSVRISFPDKSWELSVSSSGFSIEQQGKRQDGRQYVLAENSQTGVVVSITLEKGALRADPATCPGYLQERMSSVAPLSPTDIKASEMSGLPVIEYMIANFQNAPLQQKNLISCTARENVFVDIHISKSQFRAEDESLFTDLMGHIEFVQKAATSTSSANSPEASFDYFREGSRYYIADDFKNAIGPYQKAVDLEKQHRSLSTNYWRVLVDNLGMAYGISGNLQKSEETLNYGVSQDPDYPMFYYNLGCVYAERGDMNKTMDYLRKAFSLKKNAIPGEDMPDPRKDDSFQRFMSNEQFRNFANSLLTSTP